MQARVAVTPVALAARRAHVGAQPVAAVPARSARAQRGELQVLGAVIEAGVGIMGHKAGMTSIFDEEGMCLPVTVIKVSDGNVVTQVKTPETDGYTSVQVGYDEVPERKLTQPELGHLSKAGVAPMRHLTEFRVVSAEGFEAGQKLDVTEMFSEGDIVDVQGTSVGKGFQGAIKRHGFHRGPMTHGSKSHRELGSVGSGGTDPGRIIPGKKMPGRMGGKTVKIRKLKVVSVDEEKIVIRGNIPGKPGGLLRITPAKLVGKNVPPQLV
mmetsp:Transcript_30744/g.100046  ORF Transcript_30744/g.100046 Transcript_30744/m.100046 type:complete len:267 (+) Transcript_30744:25-825(+)